MLLSVCVAQEARLSIGERHMEELKAENEGKYRLFFSHQYNAALLGYHIQHFYIYKYKCMIFMIFDLQAQAADLVTLTTRLTASEGEVKDLHTENSGNGEHII